ncbi:2-dehydropantoate 2-reductase [Aquisalibacillus elongatus]|nr:2-dehydropantoate 2-reductase [Aquisalibacillus elongatus]
MNIGVIGLGAVGLFIASSLAKRHEVTGYVRREEQANEIKDQGIIVDNSETFVSVTTSQKFKEHDLIIICTKQMAIDTLIPTLELVGRHTPILFLQNGQGHIEKIHHLPHPILLGVCEHGIVKIKDNEVSLKGLGKIRLGALHKHHAELAVDISLALYQLDFPVKEHGSITDVLNRKLIVNSVINPLTAIFNCRNGSIMTNDHLKYLAKKLTKEAAMTLNVDEDEAWERVRQVAEQTKENYSSMLSDIQAKRQTEIDFINGYILKKSSDFLPYQTNVYHMVKAKEGLRE